jgi:hypothetical protein
MRRLFGDLNRIILGPPSDGKIIILSDFDKKEDEVREEKTIDTEDASTSATINTASIAFTSTDEATTRVKNDNSDDRTPDQEADSTNGSKDDTGLP